MTVKLFKVFLLVILLSSSVSVYGGTAENLFLEANSHYEKGNYAAAERIYRQILDYGLKNEMVYYNLGNACFKQNKLGWAILFYEKALKLKPNDREAGENLAIANLLKYDRLEESEPSPPLKLILWLHGLLPLNSQLLLSLFLLYVLFLLLAVLILRKKRGLPIDTVLFAMVLLFFLLILLGTSAGIKIHDQEASSFGVVLDEKIDVLSGPGESNAVLFPIHEGLKVRVRADREEWYQISLPNGLNGWVKKEKIGII